MSINRRVFLDLLVGSAKESDKSSFRIQSNFGFAGRKDSVTDLKKRLLAKLTGDDGNQFILVYSENPVADKLPGQWHEIGENYWIIPKGLDGEILFQWLYLGNWTIYEGPVVLTGLPTISEDEQAAKKWFDAAATSLVIQGYHDNDPWYVLI